MATYQRGCLIAVTGQTNFLYQSANPAMNSQKEEALDASGNTKQVDYYNDTVTVGVSALFPSGATLPQNGDTVILTGIIAPTPGVSSTFKVTGTITDTMACYVENVKVSNDNKAHIKVDFDAVRYLRNGLPTTSTST